GGQIADDTIAVADDTSDFFDHLFRRTSGRHRVIYSW
ncbi:unnamed protein product, partial [Adineta steineri]